MPDTVLTGSIYDEERRLERNAVERGVDRYRQLVEDAIDRGEGGNLKASERMLRHWFEPMRLAVRAEQKQCAKGVPAPGRYLYGHFLCRIDAKKVTVLTINAALSVTLSNPMGVKWAKSCHHVGRAVLAQYSETQLRKSKTTIERQDGTELATTELTKLAKTHKKLDPRKLNKAAARLEDDPKYLRRAQIHMGAAMLRLLIGTASAEPYGQDFHPAFRAEKRWEGPKRSIRYLVIDDRALDRIDEAHLARQHLRPVHGPMVCEPLPWSDLDRGGYLELKTPFVLHPTPEQRTSLKNADLSRVMHSTNTLGRVPWQINGWIHDTVEKLWKAGGNVIGVPRANPIPELDRPHGYNPDAPQGKRWNDVPEDVLKEWKFEQSRIKKQNILDKPERMSFCFKMQYADEMRDRGAIYFPHQLDWRGRGYPTPLYLNHQGDDVCRGLLQFAEPHELDDDAMGWLKIHLANCCGVDGVAFEDQERWVENNLETFEGWVDDPVRNTGWMIEPNGKRNKKALQALAAARALFDDEAAARLPIQLDGSCNGLQHYSALGRDPEGAAAVNLCPSDMPADVYNRVAEKLTHNLDRLASAGSPLAAKILPYVDRALCKQPTMTTVYGVTPRGMRKQISEKLVEAGFNEDELYEVNTYITQRCREAIGQVVVKARELMDWLEQCAKAVSKAGYPLAWTTPMGFPVVQPYRKWRILEIRTHAGVVWIDNLWRDAPVSEYRQVQGFAPNYIHSIDGTHMLMAAEACDAEGIDFASVHDSFWSHAANAKRMHRLLRETFVELHRQPLLENLEAELSEIADIPERPTEGDLDLDDVLASPYAFS